MKLKEMLKMISILELENGKGSIHRDSNDFGPCYQVYNSQNQYVGEFDIHDPMVDCFVDEGYEFADQF